MTMVQMIGFMAHNETYDWNSKKDARHFRMLFGHQPYTLVTEKLWQPNAGLRATWAPLDGALSAALPRKRKMAVEKDKGNDTGKGKSKHNGKDEGHDKGNDKSTGTKGATSGNPNSQQLSNVVDNQQGQSVDNQQGQRVDNQQGNLLGDKGAVNNIGARKARTPWDLWRHSCLRTLHCRWTPTYQPHNTRARAQPRSTRQFKSLRLSCWRKWSPSFVPTRNMGTLGTLGTLGTWDIVCCHFCGK